MLSGPAAFPGVMRFIALLKSWMERGSAIQWQTGSCGVMWGVCLIIEEVCKVIFPSQEYALAVNDSGTSISIFQATYR